MVDIKIASKNIAFFRISHTFLLERLFRKPPNNTTENWISFKIKGWEVAKLEKSRTDGR